MMLSLIFLIVPIPIAPQLPHQHINVPENTYHALMASKNICILLVGMIAGALIMLICTGMFLSKIKISKNFEDVVSAKMCKKGKTYYCINPKGREESIYALLSLFFLYKFGKNKTFFIRDSMTIRVVLCILVIIIAILLFLGVDWSIMVQDRVN